MLPSVVANEAVRRYGFRVVGTTDRCRVQFHAITAERRINHPAVALITEQARNHLFVETPNAVRKSEALASGTERSRGDTP